jgi:predicted nucleic-acid-binding protein
MVRANLDTNVLVRYIAQDDKRQSKLATDLIEAKGFRGLVTLVVLVETIWVLRRLYAAGKAEVEAVVDALLSNSAIEVQEAEKVLAALHRYQQHSADFSDCLIIELGENQSAEQVQTLTFDRKAVAAGMTLLGKNQ